LSENRIMWLHVLRNASIPIITHVTSQLPGLLIGAFLIERFFSIPGIGREVILAVERSDFPVIKAITVYVAVATLIFNLLADVMADIRSKAVEAAAVEARSPTLPFGGDKWGRDVLKKVIKGSETSIFVGLAAAAVATLLGTIFGAIAGYYGKWVDDFFNWFY